MKRKYHKYFFVIQTISVLGALTSIIEAYCMGKVVDYASGDPAKELTLVLVIGVNMLCQIATNISGNYLINRYANEQRKSLSRAVANKLLNAKFCDIDHLETGYILDIFSNDIEKMLTYDRTMFTIGAVILKLVLSLVGLLYMNVLVSLCIIIASVLSLVPGILVGNLQYEKNRLLSGKEDEMNEHFMRMIGLVKLIRAYTSEAYYAEKNNMYLTRYRKGKIALSNNVVLYTALNSAFSILPYITLFLVGSIFTVTGKFTIGGIVAASFFIGILGEGIDGIQNAFSAKQSNAAARERFRTIMNLKEDEESEKRLSLDEGAISFREVSFCYEGSPKILEHFNLEIHKGSKVLLQGENGAGKSTVLKLAEGLYYPEKGCVGLQKDAVVSAANQESLFFPWTVEENIRVVNRHLKEAEFEEICKVACIEKAILTSGNNKRKLSSMGKNLSKGQLQRVALARALAKEADIYFFDEPTSGLTREMEKQVLSNLLAYLKGKTVVMILHGSGYEELFDQVIRIG